MSVRYASAGAGGLVEFRLDSPTGPLVGTADLIASGGASTYKTVSATITPPDEAEPQAVRGGARRAPAVRRPPLYEIDR